MVKTGLGWNCTCMSPILIATYHDIFDKFTFQKAVFRYIETQSGVQPSPYLSYGLPQDFVDLSTGSDPFKLKDLLQLVSTLWNF